MTCILEQLKDCMSREVHCREAGYESHMSCLSGKTFCQKIVDVACPFSAENCHLCNLLRKNASRFARVIKNRSTKTPFGGNCSEEEVYCPTSLGCVPKGSLSNCTANRQFFQLGMEKEPWDKNKTRRDDAGFCMLTMRYENYVKLRRDITVFVKTHPSKEHGHNQRFEILIHYNNSYARFTI